MSYTITRHTDQLIWVVMDGHLAVHHAECYFAEMWAMLDSVPNTADLLVDGRRMAGAASAARRRTDQVIHHPNLGHIAFVVNEHHLLLFAPLVKLVSGIGLFGDELEALGYLRAARGLPPLVESELPGLTAAVEPTLNAPSAVATAPDYRAVGARHPGTRPLPPLPASRQKQTPLFPGQSLHDRKA